MVCLVKVQVGLYLNEDGSETLPGEEIARKSGGVIRTGNWSAKGSEAMALWGSRRRQPLNRGQPLSKGKSTRLGRFIPSLINPDHNS